MTMFFKYWAAAYAAAGAIFLILDMVWLRFAVPMAYRPMLGDALAEKFKAAPAVIFYLIYFAALSLVGVLPGLMTNGAQDLPVAGVGVSVLMGAIIGLTGYGTYNLTNLATLKNWPSRLAALDIAWGTVASGLASGGAALLLIKFWA